MEDTDGGGVEGPLGAQEDMGASGAVSDSGDVGWALGTTDGWLDTLGLWYTTLGAPEWLGFPSLAPESLGSEPGIPAGSSPLSAVT